MHVAQELESIQKLKKEPEDVSKIGSELGDRDYKPHGLAQREAQGAYSRRSKRFMKEVCSLFNTPPPHTQKKTINSRNLSLFWVDIP